MFYLTTEKKVKVHCEYGTAHAYDGGDALLFSIKLMVTYENLQLSSGNLARNIFKCSRRFINKVEICIQINVVINKLGDTQMQEEIYKCTIE